MGDGRVRGKTEEEGGDGRKVEGKGVEEGK